MNLKFYLIVIMFLSFLLANAQPNKIKNVAYYDKYIMYNPNSVEAINAVKALRKKLGDTLFIESKQKDTTYLIKRREALFLNFLCYKKEYFLQGENNVCFLDLAVSNYVEMSKYNWLSTYPRLNYAINEFELTMYTFKSKCAVYYKNVKFNLTDLPDSLCNCKAYILEMEKEQRNLTLLATKKEAEREAQQLLKVKLKQEMDSLYLSAKLGISPHSIYTQQSKLRIDSSKIAHINNIDSLNNYVYKTMLFAAKFVFSIGKDAEDNIDAFQFSSYSDNKESAQKWIIKFEKDGNNIKIPDLKLGKMNQILYFKLLAYLNTTKLNSIMEQNSVLYLPFKIYFNPVLTDAKTVDYKLEDGFLHIILPVIPPLDTKYRSPYMSPEEMKWNEENRKRGIKYEE